MLSLLIACLWGMCMFKLVGNFVRWDGFVQGMILRFSHDPVCE